MDGFDPDAPVTPRELRRFGYTMAAAFLVLGTIAEWRGRVGLLYRIDALLFILFSWGAVAAPARLRGPYRAWMGLAHLMSRVTTPVFLGVVYFGVFTPLGLVMRLFGRRALGGPKRGGSYWVERPPGARRSDLRRQF